MDLESRFTELVHDRTGPDFVEREWLYGEIERAWAADGVRYVLVTGEPGAGKTSLAAGMARRHPGMLRYFTRRDSRSRPEETGLTAFLLSVGHQLARRRPELFETERLEVLVSQRIASVAPGGRAVGVQVDHLSVSPFRATAMLRVDQQIDEVAGEAVGVTAGSMTVDPRLERPEILAHLALIDPARLLAEDEPGARIVLLVDGVDELADTPGGGELLGWLLAGPELPSNVRVVLTSREHDALERLRLGRPGQVAETRIDPASRRVAGDLTAYADRTLMAPPVLELLRTQGGDPDDLVRRIVRQAAGNFQYLAAYQRGLVDALERGDQAAAARLLRFDGLPPGLDALYGFFMTTVQAGLAGMGRLAARDQALQRPEAWRDVGRPVLGVLTVAREPLSVAEITRLAGLTASREALGDVLRRLRWLLDFRDGRIALFHTSLAEFLTRGDPADPAGPSWTVDEPYWHERIVRHYRGDAESWEAVEWREVDHYGLVHLAWHVLGRLGPVVAEGVALICPGLRQAIRAAFGSDRHFLRITELVTERAVDGLTLAEALPAVMFLGVVRRRLLGAGHSLSPAMLGLMARLGRTQEALERLRALPPSEHQFEGLREILRHTPEQQLTEDTEDLVGLLAEIALHVGGAEQIYAAAEALAPYDLDRALRLWRHGRSHDRDLKPPDAPDAVYRAAGAGESRRHIGLLQKGRCIAYLDLAARSSPEVVSGLLRAAELSLPSDPLDERLAALGRLAAAWLPYERDSAVWHLEAALAEADRELQAGDDKKEEELAKGLAEAAAALPSELHGFARDLLDRLELLPVNGLVDDAFVRAVGLRLEWGEHDHAREIIRRILAWNHTMWTTAKIARVLEEHDPAGALQLMERAHAEGRPASPLHGIIGRLFGDGDQETMALYLADKDPERAVSVARGIVNVTWQPVTRDRYTTLAKVAHIQLDHGRDEQPGQLLAEALRHSEAPPPLTEEDWGGPFRPAARGGSPEPPERADFRDRLTDIAYMHNVYGDWQRQRKQRLFRDPAEVVRAVLPGPLAVGNPHGWARTLRTLAEAVAAQDHDTALSLIRSLSDPGEAAVGLAGLVADAARRRDRVRESLRWGELEAALDRVERYVWADEPQDDSVLAYLRPDHRAYFDVATRILPWEADHGLALIRQRDASYLEYAYQLSFGCWASGAHTHLVLQGGAPVPNYEKMHRISLQRPPYEGHDPLIIAIAMARATANERLIAANRGRPPGPRLGTDIPDEVCAAFAALIPPDGMSMPRFSSRIRRLTDDSRHRAAAELCAFAAELLPDGDPRLRKLGEEVLAAASREAGPVHRIGVRLTFAAVPALAGLVDLPSLVKEIAALATTPGPPEHGTLRCEVFPLLLRRDPREALRMLSEALEEEWALAMAMLEYAAEPLVGAIGPEAAVDLHAAIVRGLRCTAPPGADPSTDVDGVQLELTQ